MARKRATMREGPLAELFRKTEAAQRAQEGAPLESEASVVRALAVQNAPTATCSPFVAVTERNASAASISIATIC